MKDLLILYPHGLGDCILLTPAIREFHRTTNNKIHIATLQRFESAKFFDNNPYVDQVFYTKDAWHDYPNSQLGFRSLYDEWKQKAKDKNFDGIVMPMHSQPISKIEINFKTLGIRMPSSVKTEIYTTDKDVMEAKNIIAEIVGDQPFGFVQTTTGVISKDIPAGFGRKWLKENKGLSHFIEIGKEIGALDYNINVQFEILRKAEAVCIPDSVFYHACHAMNKQVDFVYFGRGKSVYDRVRPLHEVVENIVYKLPQKQGPHE
ncbi:hypothetical protein CMI47_15765 [Candidatus Pacearchaeota archaeon]|nr:hypothetical protein [Candidatus Pacearchaeota archaeon]|tara:strand:+ start:1579 stop:2361 length:783 start_codon:yes stop_codon:yes gene_type:complete